MYSTQISKGKLFAFLSIICLALCMVFGISSNAASTGTAYISIEKFTIGQGYVAEPAQVSITEGENVKSVLERFAKEKGIQLEYTTYLTGIKNCDNGSSFTLAKCYENITNQWMPGVKLTQSDITDNPSAPDLTDGSYNSMGGWYYLVNGKDTGVTMESATVKTGDTIRLQFTLFYGSDIIYLPTVCDREAVTKQLAVYNANKAICDQYAPAGTYAKAIAVVSNMDATAAQIKSAYSSLPTETQIAAWKKQQADDAALKKLIAENTPAKAKIKTIRQTAKRSAKITWKKTAKANGYEVWTSTKKNGTYKKASTIKKASKTYYTKKNIKKKSKIFVKVRAYHVVNDQKVYGDYSAIKMLKLK